MWTKHSHLFGFADDTTSVVSNNDIDEACKLAEEDAKMLLTFMASNYLVANKEKTKLLTFVPGRDEDYRPQEIKIGESNIIETSNEKVLGLYVSNDLRWDEHIQQTKSSLRYRTCLLRRLAHSLPREHLRQLADGLVLSKIRYGLGVYGGVVRMTEEDPTDGMIRSLEVIVNDVMRTVEGVSRKDRVPIRELRSRTNIPSVNQMTAQAITTDAGKTAPAIELDGSGMKTRERKKGDLKIPVGSQISRKSFAHQGVIFGNPLL